MLGVEIKANYLLSPLPYTHPSSRKTSSNLEIPALPSPNSVVPRVVVSKEVRLSLNDSPLSVMHYPSWVCEG